MGRLPTIRMFWHGSPLSRMERLSLSSFVQNGHPVELYVYEEPPGVPAGVRLMAAAEILPREALFKHRRRQSFAMFADWFRYRLLFERGGIWADADMVCLQPFEYPSAEVFAWQDDKWINNAVLGLRAGDALAGWLADCCERPNRMLPYDDFDTRLRKLLRFVKRQGRDSMKWGETGPYGFTNAAHHLGYVERALPSWHFYPIAYEDYRVLFESPADGRDLSFRGSRAVHLWNHVIEYGRALDKNRRFPADSPFEQLWLRYMGSA